MINIQDKYFWLISKNNTISAKHWESVLPVLTSNNRNTLKSLHCIFQLTNNIQYHGDRLITNLKRVVDIYTANGSPLSFMIMKHRRFLETNYYYPGVQTEAYANRNPFILADKSSYNSRHASNYLWLVPRYFINHLQAACSSLIYKFSRQLIICWTISWKREWWVMTGVPD